MTRRKAIYKRPKAASWRTAKLFSADLYGMRWPICGTHIIWAVVGHKHVRICKPITNTRFRVPRAEWDTMQTREMRA